MCLLLEGNRTDQLESYYAMSSHNDQNSRKPDIRTYEVSSDPKKMTKTYFIAKIFGSYLAEIFFDYLDHNHLLDIMHVYHHLQNEQKLMMQSQENEFGNKNNLETGPKWAQFEPNNFFLGAITTSSC